jgi:hypothetical protein
VQRVYDLGAKALKRCSRMDIFEVADAPLEYHLSSVFRILVVQVNREVLAVYVFDLDTFLCGGFVQSLFLPSEGVV